MSDTLLNQFNTAVESVKALPLPFSCACGQRFASKGEKRRHKASCGSPASQFDTGDGGLVDDAGKFGRPWEHITAEIKARADAEWAAMDSRGRLPKGWIYEPSGRNDRG